MAAGRYVLFLNPDTVVVGDALATMVAYMDAHPDVGALGPELRYGDGSLQSSRRRFPTLVTASSKARPLAWHWPNNPWARRYRMEDQIRLRGAAGAREVNRGGKQVDWLVGAALMVRREVLAQVGGFDEGYFMYSEELDWCRRIKDGRLADRLPARRRRSSTTKANPANRSWRPGTSASRPARCATSANSTAAWQRRFCGFLF